ncbi:MAG: hypothetical protein D6805_07055 [Planctomycetota bacterium]|nr:MAG: hypothetical protein D6805_07055 [Planctomycetota bacterium]
MSAKDIFHFFKDTQPLPKESGAPASDPAPNWDWQNLDLDDVYYAKTYVIRFDTLLMGGIAGVVLLVISFFLGRLSVGEPVPNKTILLTKVVEERKQNRDSSAIQSSPKAKVSSSQERPKVSSPVPQSKYELQVLTSPTQKGAEDVVAFLKKKNIQAYIKRIGRFYCVRVAGFQRPDYAFRDKIRRLLYRGRTWFESAYFVRRKS